MDVCIRNPNRTAPVGGACRRGDGPVCSRTNGWTWPPHPLQLLAWMLYVYFAVTVFGVLIPLLPTHWIPAGYICTCVMFASHLCVHLMAVSIDPADSSVRSKTLKGPVPALDRAKHTHVIENCHCYLCQVDVGPKSKHCSACNKCVANFDHHCRWLNNCVGSRNYKLFLHSVISALLGVTLVLVVASYVFIEFFVDPSKLRSDKHFLVRNETIVWYVFLPLSPIRSAAAVIPAVAAVTVAMALMSLVLLCHLLCFHLYLMWNRLSTYEYIVRQRHRSRDLMKQGSLKETAQDVNFPGTLGYTNAQLDVEEDTRGEAEFHPNGRVITVSSPVMEEETTHSVSTEAAGHTQRRTQKKKKKVCKVPAEVNTAPPPAADQGSVSSTVSLGQRLPFSAFPLRASLPQTLPPLTAHTHTHRHTATDAHTHRHTDAHTHRHTPPLPGPVQPANPPADYHSDSAESLEEIPMVMAKLGSTSSHTHSHTHTPSHNTHREGPSHTHINTHSHTPSHTHINTHSHTLTHTDRPSHTHINTHSHTDRPSHTHRNLFPFPTLPSPLPRAKRKTSSSSRANKTVEMAFEMSPAQPPSVFVSRASGDTRPSSRMDGPIN